MGRPCAWNFILIRFLDYFNIFALCDQFWKIWNLGPLIRRQGLLLVPFLLKIGSPLGPLFRIFGSPWDWGTVLTSTNQSSMSCKAISWIVDVTPGKFKGKHKWYRFKCPLSNSRVENNFCSLSTSTQLLSLSRVSHRQGSHWHHSSNNSNSTSLAALGWRPEVQAGKSRLWRPYPYTWVGSGLTSLPPNANFCFLSNFLKLPDLS